MSGTKDTHSQHALGPISSECNCHLLQCSRDGLNHLARRRWGEEEVRYARVRRNLFPLLKGRSERKKVLGESGRVQRAGKEPCVGVGHSLDPGPRGDSFQQRCAGLQRIYMAQDQAKLTTLGL